MHGFPLYPATKQIVQSINQKLIDKKCNILYTAASSMEKRQNSGGSQRGDWSPQYLELQKHVHIQQTHNQGLCYLFLVEFWVIWAYCTTPGGYISVVHEVMHEARSLEGLRVSTKSPSRMRDGEEGVVERNYQKKVLNRIMSLICPSDKLMLFYLSG